MHYWWHEILRFQCGKEPQTTALKIKNKNVSEHDTDTCSNYIQMECENAGHNILTLLLGFSSLSCFCFLFYPRKLLIIH